MICLWEPYLFSILVSLSEAQSLSLLFWSVFLSLLGSFSYRCDLSLHWSACTWRMIAHRWTRLSLEESVLFSSETSQWSFQSARVETGWLCRTQMITARARERQKIELKLIRKKKYKGRTKIFKKMFWILFFFVQFRLIAWELLSAFLFDSN